MQDCAVSDCEWHEWHEDPHPPLEVFAKERRQVVRGLWLWRLLDVDCRSLGTRMTTQCVTYQLV